MSIPQHGVRRRDRDHLRLAIAVGDRLWLSKDDDGADQSVEDLA